MKQKMKAEANKGARLFFLMKKNETFIGVCQDLTETGLGIVKNEGFCFFVKDCLPDEKVEVLVTALKKNYGFGIVKKRLTVSESRIQPRCSVFKQCGGCQLQHCDYVAQLKIKQKHVADCFARIAKLDVHVNEVIGMENPYAYRNKVQVPVSYQDHQLKMGFYRQNTNDIIEFKECSVQTKMQNELLQQLKVWIKELDCGEVFRHILIKHAHRTNQIMVVLIVNQYPFKNAAELVKRCSAYSEVKSIIANINKRDDNVILGNREFLLYGSSTIQEELEGLKFNISSKSFYQINPIQTQVLYKKAIELAKIQSHEIVADVYCGTGTIGIFASRYAKHVIGIEVVKEAVEDAQRNAKLNNIQNIEFICSDAGAYTQKLAQQNRQIDVAIVDPPRKGLDSLAIDSLVKMNPNRIIYISCDPATLARDCALFDQAGYHVQFVQPVDLFPQTMHVECCCLLTK